MESVDVHAVRRAGASREDWPVVRLDEFVENVAVRVDPAKAKAETYVYIGLEHLDPGTLHLREWGHIHPMSPGKNWSLVIDLRRQETQDAQRTVS